MSWIERAYVGQKVTPIDSDPWSDDETGEYTDGPACGDICEISAIVVFDGDVCLRLIGWDAADDELFTAKDFGPVHDTIKQVEALKRICLNTPEAVA